MYSGVTIGVQWISLGIYFGVILGVLGGASGSHLGLLQGQFGVLRDHF